MAGVVLTRFPDLCGTTASSIGPDIDAFSTATLFSGLLVPRETLLIAWASLLTAYTGHEETVFLSNEDIARFDSPQKPLDFQKQSTTNFDARGGTAVHIGNVGSDIRTGRSSLT